MNARDSQTKYTVHPPRIRYSYVLKNVRGKWLRAQFGFASHLALVSHFISYEKWMQS